MATTMKRQHYSNISGSLFLQLDEFLSKMDDPNYWRTVRDKVTGKETVLSDEQIDEIQGLQKSNFPAATSDPYEVSR